MGQYAPCASKFFCHWCATAGIEVGQYAGYVRSLRALQQSHPDSIPSRIERNLAAMEECLLQFPLYDPLVRTMLRHWVRHVRARGWGAGAALGGSNLVGGSNGVSGRNGGVPAAVPML